MIGGKGGVGKTTCAAAIAYQKALEGKRVLIVSSDPAPSLSDIFDVTLGSDERRISSDLPLFGMEISSDVVLKRWKERFGPEIYEVISSFADVDYDFVDYVGTAPGIEEEYMLSFIVDLVEGGTYDVVVWDTAPAGHTLRLLNLPRLFLRHLEAATKFYLNMFSYLEKLRDTVRLKGTKRTLLEVIAGWEALSERIVRFITDEELTSYVLVTIPEALGVKLTERIVAEFHQNGLKVGNLVVNYVIKNADCEFHIARKAMQEHYVAMLSQMFGNTNMVQLYLRPREVKGIQSISEVADALFLTVGKE
jgi:arsenite-transporting ATPase